MITITNQMRIDAQTEKERRDTYITHHFSPNHTLDTDIIGFLGELCACQYLDVPKKQVLENEHGKPDDQDILLDWVKIDVKTETIPNKYFWKVLNNDITADEPYYNRIINVNQISLLHKYHYILFGIINRDDPNTWCPVGIVPTSVLLQKKPTQVKKNGYSYPTEVIEVEPDEILPPNTLKYIKKPKSI